MSALDTRAISQRASQPLDITPLLHPTEHTRLLLAFSASAITFGGAGILLFTAGGLRALFIPAAAAIVASASVWFVLQIVRARLLGHSIRVTAESLPEIHEIFDEIRDLLDYHQPIDVYVAQKTSTAVSLTSYLGTKIILLEGDLIGDLVHKGERAQLTFLLARCVGALKARHERLTVVLVLIATFNTLRFLNPFLLPYYRATTYSGDQIGQVCCGSVTPALSATGRLLVGKELEPELHARGVIDQAESVRSRWLPRFAQMTHSEPHLTNRYLNVLFFARRTDPEGWEVFEADLDEGTGRRVHRLWNGSHHQRLTAAPPSRGHLSTAIATVITVGALAAITLAAPSLLGKEDSAPGPPHAEASSLSGDLTSPVDLQAPPPPPIAPTHQRTRDEERLMAHVPPALRASCSTNSDSAATDAIASVVCNGASLYYNRFATKAAMQADWQLTKAGIGHALTGRCQTGSFDGTWTAGGVTRGPLLCWKAQGTRWIAWTDDRLRISAELLDSDGTSRKLFNRWLQSGPI